MAELPTGTITFLFTDVEGSTRLWEQHPQTMRGVMARHDALLTEIFARHDGVVVRPRGEGDSLFAVFVRASAAVAAALAGQGRFRPRTGGRSGRCGCAWRCTPARPTSERATTTAAP
ncbi:MAG TPA: adenylate/guanylate cyclase domain-containing protein [Dehalococcoidia bacterium]|nr:adenylate/guanylate cyclase domain-containing protein [Dehalococcoidia bacterium]